MTRAETFSYLPPLTDDELRAQVAGITGRGLIPSIEYVEHPDPRDSYWRLWKLPFVDHPAPDAVLAEIAECAAANPRAHIKLVGYDSVRQGQVAAFVVRRPE
ncbi:MAG: ribulose bisphosphate carboxylase small subunit [Gaiellales bacterium]